MLLTVSVGAPEKGPRLPSKSLILAEKLHRASMAMPKGWIKRPEHLAACRCLVYWTKRLQLHGHEEMIASLMWVESRYDPKAVSRKGAVGVSQINPTWNWYFERELWKVGYVPKGTHCDNVALGVAAYKVKLSEAFGDPLEAVRIYNHATHPFSYKHQLKVLRFYNELERQ